MHLGIALVPGNDAVFGIAEEEAIGRIANVGMTIDDVEAASGIEVNRVGLLPAHVESA